jgi:hypothetical protein
MFVLKLNNWSPFFTFNALEMINQAIANYLGMSHRGASKMIARGRAISWSKGIT